LAQQDLNHPCPLRTLCTKKKRTEIEALTIRQEKNKFKDSSKEFIRLCLNEQQK
jgi:hypothetical protein